MHSSDSTADFFLSLSARKRIHDNCEQFIEAWKSVLLDDEADAIRPIIEDYLVNCSDAERNPLFTELLDVDLHYRRKTGEVPTKREYEDQFPDYHKTIARAFSSAANVGADQGAFSPGLHIRCPHCHNPLELVPDAELVNIDCPSCGSSFSLLNEGLNTRVAPTVTRVGNFELIERLGMGAYGTVWKARDTVLDRTVAVKIPRASQLTSDETEKFFREARAAAQLRHPNIVRVYEVGRDGETVFIVSDFVRGVPLSNLLADRRLNHREATQLALKTVLALEHAHQAGVIHRDLKPQNIMIDGQGEPYLMDFGLAKREAGEITMTVDGQVFGTPAYMSPEQARGEGHNADRRSDIYSFGVVLFQLLTGELPFRGSNPMLIHKILNDEVTSLRRLDRNISKDLETICLKCLEKEPNRRFDTASDIAEELGRHLRGEPIHTRSISAANRIWRWSKRNPVGAILLAVLVSIALISPLIAVYLAHVVDDKNEALYQSLYEQARAQWHSGESGWRAAALDAVKDAAQIRVEPELTELVVQILTSHDFETIREFELRDDQGLLAVASNGNEYAIVTATRSRVERRVTNSGKLIASWDSEGQVTFLKYSPDTKKLAIGYESGEVCIWTLEGTRQTSSFSAHDSMVEAIAFGPGQNRLTTTDGMRVKIWDVSRAELLYTDVTEDKSPGDQEETPSDNKKHLMRHRVTSLVAGEKTLIIAAATNEGLGHVWRFDERVPSETRKTVLALGDHARLVFTKNAQHLVAAYNVDVVQSRARGRRLGTPARDDAIELKLPYHKIRKSNYSPSVGAFVTPFLDPGRNTNSAFNLMAYSLAVMGSYVEIVEVPSSMEPAPSEDVHVAQNIETLELSISPTIAATEDISVPPNTETNDFIGFPTSSMTIDLGKRPERIRQLGPRQNVRVLLLDLNNKLTKVDVVDIALGRLVGLAMDPIANQLMVAGASGGVGLCSIQSGRITCRRAWLAVPQNLDAVHLLPKSTNFMTVQNKKQVETHRIAGVEIHDVLLRTADEWSRIAFSGDKMIVARWEGGISFYDRHSGVQLGGLDLFNVHDLEITDRGDRIVTVDRGSAVLATQFRRDQKEARFIEFEGQITPFVPKAIALRGDGRFLAVSGESASINMWEYVDEKYRFLRRLEPEDSTFRQLVFGRAGIRLAAGSDDGGVTVWDTKSWSQLWQYDDGPASPVSALAFNESESVLAVGHTSGDLLIYDLESSTHRMLSFEHEVLSFDFHSENALLLVGLRDGTIVTCDPSEGQVLKQWHGHNESVMAIRFEADGTSFTSGGSNGEVRRWNLQQIDTELQRMGLK